MTTLYTDGAAPIFQSGKELYIWTGKTFTPGATLDINGDVEVATGATLDVATNTFSVAGNVDNNGTLTHTGTITFDGTSQTFDPGTVAIANDITIASGTVTLATNALNIGANDLTIASGAILSIAGQNVTAGTLSNSGTFRLRGSETLTITTPDTDSGTFEYKGNGDSAATTFTVKDFGATDYYNITIASTDANDTFELG